MVEVNVNRFAARPTPRTKRPRPSKRLRDRVRNRAHYAAKTAAARVEFLVLASSAVDKLGAALDAWGRNDRWFVPIASPGQVGEEPGAVLPRPKEVALVKRAQVVHKYLQLQVKSGNINRLQNQREVAVYHNVSAPLVASWTRDFLHLEPRPDPPAASGGGEDTTSAEFTASTSSSATSPASSGTPTRFATRPNPASRPRPTRLSARRRATSLSSAGTPGRRGGGSMPIERAWMVCWRAGRCASRSATGL